MPIDYASIIGAAEGLVPSLRQQMLEREELGARREETALRRQALAAKVSEAQASKEREAQFAAARDKALQNPTPGAVARLMIEFPEFGKDVKAGFDLLDEDQRRTNLTQMGSIYFRAQRGDYTGAADLYRRRIDADKAAGQDTAEDEQLLAALEGTDPNDRKVALGEMGFRLRAVDPDGFDKMFPEAKAETDLEKKYRFLIGERGQAYADQWLSEQTQDVVVGQPGAPVYRKSDIIGGGGFATPSAQSATSQPRGGDPESRPRGVSGARPVASAVPVVKSLWPEARITDNRRDPKSRLGRANPSSWHNRSGAAIDVAPIPGVSFEQYVAKYRAAGFPIIEARDEVANPSGHATGPHWHLVLGQPAEGPPVRVKSVRQARGLAPGTRFLTPDGQLKVR